MPTTVSYFVKESIVNTFRLQTGTLADNDLVRGDDVGEGVLAQGSTGFTLFNGYQVLDFSTLPARTVDVSPEILATVTFSDGTSLTGVRGLYEQVTGTYGFSSQYFLIDPQALAAVGKSMTDVVDVVRTGATDHDLSWADFGFTAPGANPILPPPPPPPPPPLNRIEGTSGRDVLRGTDGDDLIIANGGNRDRLTGNGGEDTFVFGAQVGNGVRDIAVITDYDAFEDTLLLTNGARMARYTEGTDTVTIFLAGADGDRIILQNVPDSGPLFKLQFDDAPFV
jgi:Ca2+-binding RTX toxin-like protein